MNDLRLTWSFLFFSLNNIDIKQQIFIRKQIV
jgi:hypothetical protein